MFARNAATAGAAVLVALGAASPGCAATLDVPAVFPTIQAALDAAVAGDVIDVDSGVYNEKIVFPASGDTISGPIVLRAAPSAATKPVLDGSGVPGANMVLIDSKSHVTVRGFEIVNNLGVNDGSGVRVVGGGSAIEIRDNEIHEIRGQHAMGITVYGTDALPIEDLVIDGNEIYDCDPAQSEALTLNGNVRDFEVTNNVVRDVNSIGIDFIGGETDIQPDPALVAREGIVRGNTVVRANANYGGGFAGGIYVDGGRDIVIENNVVTESDLGIEIGAENAGLVTTNVVVRNNVVYRNEKAGIVFGGYAASVGRANGNEIRGNTLYDNTTAGLAGGGEGEIWIQHAENNVVENNIVVAGGENVLVASFAGSVANDFDFNLYYTVDGTDGRFTLNDDEYDSLGDWQAGTAKDANSAFADPSFVAPASGDFHIASASPARDAGDPGYSAAPGETDLDGAARVSGVSVDCGADEAGCGDGALDPGETCDDGNPVDGDGCDSNCTPTGCGNTIVTAGEQCDDGNTANGDCCAAGCTFEAAGAPCEDPSVCTDVSTCDGVGACIGDAAPAAVCSAPAQPRGGSLVLKNKNGKSRLVWKWSRGLAVDVAEFGAPPAFDDYTMCVHVQDGGGATLLVEAVAPAGPAWDDRGAKGFRYKEKSGVPDGMTQVRLRPGAEGKAKLKAKAKGGHFDLGGLGLDSAAVVTARLKGPGAACYGFELAAPFSKNDATRFSDKSD